MSDNKPSCSKPSCNKAMVIQVFEAVFGLPESEIVDLDRRHYAQWDSMKMLSIVTALENQWGIYVEAEDVEHWTTFNDVYTYVENNV